MGNSLKTILIDEGITQRQLAGEAGLSGETVNKLCNQKRECAPVTRSKVIKALNRIVGSEKYTVKETFDVRRAEK